MVTAARCTQVLPKHGTGSPRVATLSSKWVDAGAMSIAIAIASARFVAIGHSAWETPDTR